MVRVLINYVDSYVGQEIGKRLSESKSGSLKETIDEGSDAEEAAADVDSEPIIGANYELVGTLLDPGAQRPKWISEIVDVSDDNVLKEELLKADVVIYHLIDDLSGTQKAMEMLYNAREDFDSVKHFVCLSTILTWARTKVDPDDLDTPFTEDDYRRRRAHPNFKDHLGVEKLVIKCGKKEKGSSNNLNTHVIAAGLLYGQGESIFHHLFKTAWHGEEAALSIFGSGENVTPTIHVSDLSSIVYHVIETKLTTRYILAIDESTHTLEEIVRAVSEHLGTRQVKKVSKEDALLLKDIAQVNYDMLLVNLRLEAGAIKDFKFEWIAENGFVENMDILVSEYKDVRGLSALKIMLHGPPASGKTHFAELLCKHYKLYHIKINDVIQEAVARLEKSSARLADRDDKNDIEDMEQAEQDHEFIEELQESARNNNGRYPEEHVVQFFRDKLASMPCRNQGYILDGYPKHIDQASELFKNNEQDDETEGNGVTDANWKTLPNYIISLDVPDDFLKERVMNLPESAVAGTHNTEEGLLRRLELFRATNLEEETVLNYFDELEIHPVIINGTDGEATIMARMVEVIGKPHNYGPTAEEIASQQKIAVEERMAAKLREREDLQRREEEESEQRRIREQEWQLRLDEVRKQEQDVLESQSIPLRNYLVKHVMPTVTKALIDVCKARPDDPIDFLAEYLFRHDSK